MVQRKVPKKLGIQAEHVKSEKRLGNLKPASCQHQDGKSSRGPDMKKKMKRSRSIKLSDIESLKTSSPSRKTISQPGKPPPVTPPTAVAASLKKQPTIRAGHGSPNYMKSTSSSEARKERSPVSSLNTQASPDRKNLHQRNLGSLKHTSAYSNKPTKNLKKSSSLKLVRTLTKTPSFKPVRGTAKKCSGVALCADVNVQKATCSSTQKDSKFPAYLMLNPGGTEAEGTSVMKVCPYTYCSLNGHYHTPLPPLKCFLKARRRSLKTQKSVKMEILSPRRAKPYGDRAQGIIDCLLGSSDEKSPDQEIGSFESVKVPSMPQIGADFFIEIYAKPPVATPEKSLEEDGLEARELGGINSSSWFHGSNEVEVQQDKDKLAFEHIPAESPHPVMDFVGCIEERADTSSVDADGTERFPGDQKPEDADAEYTLVLTQESAASSCQEETKEEGFSDWSNIERKCQLGVEDHDNISEAIDMDWEEQFSDSEVNMEDDYSNMPGGGSRVKIEDFPETMDYDLHGKAEIISDDIVSSSSDEILAGDILHNLSEEETASFNNQCNHITSEIDSTIYSWEILESTQPPSKDAFEELTDMAERDTISETDSVCSWLTSASTEAPGLELTAASDGVDKDGDSQLENVLLKTNPQLGEAKLDCISDIKAGTWDDQQDDGSINADGAMKWLQNPNEHSGHISDEIADTSASFSDSDQDHAEVNSSHKDLITKAYEHEEVAEDSSSSKGPSDDSNSADPDNLQFNNQNDGINTSERQNLMEEDLDEAKEIKFPAPSESKQQNGTDMHGMNSAGDNLVETDKIDEEDCTRSDTAETFLSAKERTSPGSECPILYKRRNSNLVLPSICNNRRWTIGCGKPRKDFKEEREFNPRDPNFLPVVPDPEPERVDLKHQMMDDRKNAEEWMLDYALQRAVTKLAPARKRKVALLVEAFETVLPIQKYDTHIRRSSTAFSPRPIQACS